MLTGFAGVCAPCAKLHENSIEIILGDLGAISAHVLLGNPRAIINPQSHSAGLNEVER